MDRLEEVVDSIIDQPIEGLLYDLDLLPEQCISDRSNMTRIVIEKQRKEIERLKKMFLTIKKLIGSTNMKKLDLRTAIDTIILLSNLVLKEE